MFVVDVGFFCRVSVGVSYGVVGRFLFIFVYVGIVGVKAVLGISCREEDGGW